MVKRIIKKPIPIEAIKVVKENEEEIIDFLNNGTTSWETISDKNGILGYRVHSWEGVDPVLYDVTKNKNGNGKPYWIIKGLKNECYPCASDDVDDMPLGYMEYEEC